MKLYWTLLTAVSLMTAGCNDDPREGPTFGESDARDESGGRGGADVTGSCAPADCGGQASNGTCWCDAQCVDHGDCCTDRDAVCGEQAPDTDDSSDTGGPVDDPPDDPSDTDGSADTDDSVDEPDDSAPHAFAIHGVANLDDDDGSQIDWYEAPFAADDDLSTLVLEPELLASVPADALLRLELEGDAETIRVWHDGQLSLGASSDASFYEFAPEPAGETLTFEFGAHNATGILRVSIVTAEQTRLLAQVDLRAAPLILNHHLQPAERVFAMHITPTAQWSHYHNTSFIETYEAVLGDRFTSIPGRSLYGNDVWVQDEFQFATLTGDEGQRLDVVIDSIRDRGLDDYPEDALVGPGVIAQTWGNPLFADTFDAFGNLEVSPPVVVDGVSYPFGRIYYGASMNAQLGAVLAAQRVQAPFTLDTDWLCVGHIDEVSTFVPDPGSEKGFKLLLADVPSAYALLDQLPASMELPQYEWAYGFETVGDLRGNANLRLYNDELQFDHLDAIREIFKTELGLTDDDIIEIPALFERAGGTCGSRALALIPGTVNLVVVDVDGQPNLFIPDPFFRSDLNDQSSDPIIADFTARMPDGLALHYVDDWDVYHMAAGEVHCGTNVIRTPTETWWDAAAHLLEGN